MGSVTRLLRLRAGAAGAVLTVGCAGLPGSIAHVVAGTPASAIVAATDGAPDIRDLMQAHPLHVSVRHRAARAATASPVVAIVSPCPAYGTVLIPGSMWLGGLGVDVMSNGGTGPSCYDTGSDHRWQCGELVNRFLAVRRWGPAIPGNAGGFYANASGTAFDKHPIGSGYLPVPGDIVVWSGGAGGFGHVAIVVGDAGGRLTVVEQNSTITGYGSFPIAATGSIGPAGGLTPVGYLHAKANPNQPPPPPPSSTPVVRAAAAPHHPAGGPSTTPSPSPSPSASPSRSPQPTPSATSTPTPTPTATPTSGLGGLLGGG